MVGQLFLLVAALILLWFGLASKLKSEKVENLIWGGFLLALAVAVHFWGWTLQALIPFAVIGTILYILITRVAFKRLWSSDQAGYEREVKRSRNKIRLGLVFIALGLLVFALNGSEMMLGFAFGGMFILLDYLWDYLAARNARKGETTV